MKELKDTTKNNNIDNNLQSKKQYALKLLVKYAASSIGAMVVFSIYTMIDGIFVARGVGDNALAAVNLAMPIMSISFALSILFSVGASTLISIEKGKKNFGLANKLFNVGILKSIIIAGFITILIIFNLDKICIWLGGNEQTLKYLRDYLAILVFFNVCYMLSYYFEVLVKADGYPQKAMIYPILGGVVNIALDYIFIMKFGYGIKGAAVATGLAQLTSLIAFIYHFISHKDSLTISIRSLFYRELSESSQLFLYFKHGCEMVKLGIADSITELAVGIIIFVFNKSLLHYAGNDGIIAFTIISYVSQLILMIIVGLNQGMQPLISYYYGKRDKLMIKLIYLQALKYAIAVSIISTIVCTLLSNAIVGFFLDESNAHLYEFASKAFSLYSISYLPLGFVIITAGVLTSLKEAKWAMLISVCRGVVFVIISLYIMARLFGSDGIFLATSISEFAALILSLIIYRAKLHGQIVKSYKSNSIG